MRRRSLLKGMAGAATVSATASTIARATGRQRNVLLLISDDQGLDLGCYGTPVATPRLDRLAGEGTRFSHAFAAVSSCSPSRAVIHTGLYGHQNGMYGLQHDVHHQSLLDGVETLPSMLRRAGYATALVGKKHIGPDKAFPFEAELVPERSGIRDVREMAVAAASFIRSTSDRPFFVTVAYSDPHRAATDYGNDRAWPGVTPVSYDPATVHIPPHLPDLPEVRRDLAEYYESLSRLDTGVGMLLDLLAESGRAEDTLVVFLSDNGRPFPGAKTNLYAPGLHLPLIVRAPGSTASVNDAMVSWIDIAPTILDWAGVAAPGYPLSGRSLLSILGKAGDPARDAVFASHEFHEINQYYPMRAVRTRTHSYILNLAHPLDYPIAGDVAGSPSWKAIRADRSIRLGRRTQAAYLRRPAEELYDLTRDPDEVTNVVGSRAYAGVLAELRARMLKMRIDTRDPWLAGQTDPYAHLKQG
ncbi:sulfatase [Sphingomonas koreensis]|jgi:N-sulfoglucosamine sulfohydrolase|uniref:Sulfatase n=2 Tax=Sphingomonas koreensis TaxID=93064 RepID=A0AAJ4S0B9_9SPHN|nr:sulfatase [Sphingomonas koreensis]MDC7810287.1 sulfatase [Sphingomonas koreensis]RSU17794.1 sulfatase [Sphingomonas koreensis]RSU20875.1 sulfatase [Sphingomonas koreensis]RSU23564.1 sulfatase [Sphingomonas koreensis]RSU31020.1 sulfatase [Sphingomonas koreensis]